MKKNSVFLIVGANGLVGKAVFENVSRGYDFVGTYCKRSVDGLIKLDCTDNSGLENIFKKVKPDFVINCSNLAGGVNFCEFNPREARKFHVDSTHKMVELCRQYNSQFVFISTDYIFDGKKAPYKEDDIPSPLNLYGKLKLEAEELIKESLEKYLIIRTTNVFGWDPETVTPNYIMNLYTTLKKQKKFNAPSFLWGNPTYADDLAKAIVKLCSKDVTGVFHVVGSSSINRYDWAKDACKIFGFDPALIDEIKQPSDNMVPRPLKSFLNNEKFVTSHETVLHDAAAGLKMMYQKIEE